MNLPAIRFVSLPGLVSWQEAHELQLRTLQERIDDRVPDTVFFLEHTSVVTRGRGLQRREDEDIASSRRHAPFDPSILPPGTRFIETERGGDLTWHGPGQLVIYPIIKLDGKGFGPDHDIHQYIRNLERIVIRTLSQFGIRDAHTVPSATGVWVGNASTKKKIASLGIAVRKWVSYHGVGLNLSAELSVFRLFEPCGFSPDVMTRLQDWIPAPSSSTLLRDEAEEHLAKQIIEIGQYKSITWDHARP